MTGMTRMTGIFINCVLNGDEERGEKAGKENK
jgi:hypothetical protein